MSQKIEVEEGQRFGRLVLIREIEAYKGRRKFLLMCDCTNLTEVSLTNLRKGKTQSCGCLQKERTSSAKKTHGKTHTTVYHSWLGIKQRCYNPNHPDYDLYGGIGLGIYEEWKESFENFYSFIGDPPDGQRWSIERLNNDIGYLPGNIEWALPEKQARNKGKSRANTSGFTGVYKITNHIGATYWTAKWINLDGKQRSKSFSEKVYGSDEAFKLACEYRSLQIRRLNDEGANYSENHGE